MRLVQVVETGPVKDMLQAAVLEGTRGIAREEMRVGPETPPAIVAGIPRVTEAETSAGIAAEMSVAIAAESAIEVEMPAATAVGTWRAIGEALAATRLLGARYR